VTIRKSSRSTRRPAAKASSAAKPNWSIKRYPSPRLESGSTSVGSTSGEALAMDAAIRSARLASCSMMTRRGTRAAAPVRLTGAFVLVGVGASVVCVATGSWDGVRVGAVGASDTVGSAAAQPAVSSATISSAKILTAGRLGTPRYLPLCWRRCHSRQSETAAHRAEGSGWGVL